MTGPVRAALYLRVSTTRQAEVDLSIPDQQAQTSAYCARRGWRVVAEYVEPGASAMDDHRPEFQRMIERACDDDRPIDMSSIPSHASFATLSALKCMCASSPSTACGSSRSPRNSATIRRR